MDKKVIVGFTQGDVNGIAYELLIKLMAENKLCEVCTPVVFGSSKVAAYHRKALNIENLNLNSIQRASEASTKRCNIINCVDDAVKVDLGQETAESDQAAMLALNVALDALDRREIDVLVGLPQGDCSFKPASGCMAFLSERYQAHQAMPLLVGKKIKVGFVTDFLPFRDIADNMTFNTVFNKLKLLDACLKRDFAVRKPRIAVLALNPQAGAKEMYGDAEKNVIVPVIEKARENGIMALGPYTSSALFCGMSYEKFDAVLAMYYDQGAIPFRAVEGNEGAMLVAGLPVVYASPAHGMAFDIAGQGVADDAGVRRAMYVAIDVCNNRAGSSELVQNPLKHYDIETNANENDLNVEQISGMEKESED